MGLTVVFLVVNILLLSVNAELFSKCKLSDSNCIVNEANKFVPVFTLGIPELKVSSLDPVYIKYIDASTGTLKFLMTENNLTGIKNSKIKSIKINESKSTISIVYTVYCQLDGLYEMSGNLLFLPIMGKGPLHTKLAGTEIHMNLNLKEVMGEDGKKHWSVSYKSHKYFAKGKSDVVFENLFEGNEVLAQAAQQMISQNGNAIVTEIGGPAVRAVIDVIINSIEEFLKAVPAEDLYVE
ncbi:circadian clock-controlled protein daywake-like [Aricia agestis]|uniref:circadian clock-controlled protein daywake-like n=1 Tax=Aricia agestis TaxID=91739 RepID=UPI001C203BE7|nr:circadian clock-controlled protein daywake-like [Aricia agestis]